MKAITKTSIKSAKKKPIGSRKTKLEKEDLKNFVFEKVSLGWTQKKVAEVTGFSEQHICAINKEIEEEFYLQVTEVDRERLISKETRRLEGITRKLYKKLDEEQNPNKIVMLHGQILKTIEFKTKLQGLLVERISTKNEIEGFTEEEANKFNELFN